MNIPKPILERNPLLAQNSIITGYVGSISHGTYDPGHEDSIDDRDVMSIVVPPLSYYFGLDKFGSRDTKVIQDGEWDIVCYEVRKFVRLLIKSNPNVLGLLWLDETSYIGVRPAGWKLIDNRRLFVSKQAYHSFVGYATSQLRRMTHYSTRGYMGEKRKQLVDKYGYDTKNASHLIRLLRMGIEYLHEGQLHVRREDSQQLLEIKYGGWSLEKVKREAEHLFKRAEYAYDRSKIPAEPDINKINKLCVEIVAEETK